MAKVKIEGDSSGFQKAQKDAAASWENAARAALTQTLRDDDARSLRHKPARATAFRDLANETAIWDSNTERLAAVEVRTRGFGKQTILAFSP